MDDSGKGVRRDTVQTLRVPGVVLRSAGFAARIGCQAQGCPSFALRASKGRPAEARLPHIASAYDAILNKRGRGSCLASYLMVSSIIDSPRPVPVCPGAPQTPFPGGKAARSGRFPSSWVFHAGDEKSRRVAPYLSRPGLCTGHAACGGIPFVPTSPCCL